MIEYRGTRSETNHTLRVHLHVPDAKPKRLALRTELMNHSPTGFECGYEGSGPAQLALAICADHLARHEIRAESASMIVAEDIDPRGSLAERVAVRIHQDFKRDVIAKLPREGWSLTDQAVGAAIDSITAKRYAEQRKRAS